MKILVLEDDGSLRATLKKRLTASGFTVECAENGEEGLHFLRMGGFDLVISDIMMPVMNGLEFLSAIRAKKIDLPVILLTALDGSGDIVKGLDMGADDYIVKPFEFPELLARIRLVTRRSAGSRENLLTVKDLTLDIGTRTVVRGGEPISLSAKEFDLLALLIRNKNIVLTRERICDSLYGIDDCVGSNTVDVYIRYLRKKIDDGYEEKLIHTVRGVGYTVKE